MKFDKSNFKYSTGLKILPQDWDFENRLPKTKRGAAGAINKNLSTNLRKYSKLLDDIIQEHTNENIPLERVTLRDRFDEVFKHKKKIDFNLVDIINEFIYIKNSSNSKSRYWVNKYENVRNKIIFYGYYLGDEVHINEIDSDWILSYCGFLRSFPEIYIANGTFAKKVDKYVQETRIRLPKKGLNDNSLQRHIVNLKTLLFWSHGKYHSVDVDGLENPVSKYQSDDVYLSENEVIKLENVDLPYPYLTRVRDVFLIGVYSGQRYSDYSVFENADVHNGLIIKRAEKTEYDSIIPLHDKLKHLLDKYDWEIPRISEQKFRDYIKKVCEIAGIDAEVKKINYVGNQKEVVRAPKYSFVGTHTARRTFITLSAERGMPDHVIMKITGIRDSKTLKIYKKTSAEVVKEMMNRYW